MRGVQDHRAREPDGPKYHLGELTKRKQPRHPRGMRRDVKLRKLG